MTILIDTNVILDILLFRQPSMIKVKQIVKGFFFSLEIFCTDESWLHVSPRLSRNDIPLS
jgi:hypothetical protein